MTPRRRRSLIFLLVLLIALVAAGGLVAVALQKSVTYYYGPAEVVAHKVAPGTTFRLGGLVEPGSLVRSADVLRFRVTDGVVSVAVLYRGLPPALFAEGKGVVATGHLDETGLMVADQLLAKHDERYTPPEVVETLKKSGRWQHGQIDAPAGPGGQKTPAEPGQ